MSYGLTEKTEPHFFYDGIKAGFIPKWKKKSRSGFSKWAKQFKNRCERRRAKQNPECQPMYNKHRGWEF